MYGVGFPDSVIVFLRSFGSRVSGFRFRISGFRFPVSGIENLLPILPWVYGLGCTVQGFRFRVSQ